MTGMGAVRLAAAAAHFGRDLDYCVARIKGIVADARKAGATLLVLPDAALGGYLADLRHPDPNALPPALPRDDALFADLAAEAGDLVVVLGYTEADGEDRYNAAICLTGSGTLGHYRKVHQPPGEALVFRAGEAFAAFDTPAGRLGLLIDYDKSFPEAARTLALAGAEILAIPCAWPASVTNRAARLVNDRQSRLFDLYDSARAAENQLVVVSANQTGTMGGLRFLGQSKIVGPGGEVLARTYATGGLAVAELDVQAEIRRARQVQHHLNERRPGLYS